MTYETKVKIEDSIIQYKSMNNLKRERDSTSVEENNPV